MKTFGNSCLVRANTHWFAHSSLLAKIVLFVRTLRICRHLARCPDCRADYEAGPKAAAAFGRELELRMIADG